MNVDNTHKSANLSSKDAEVGAVAIGAESDETNPAMVNLEIDGINVTAPKGTTILEAARDIGAEIPTLCYLETLTPVNVCRVCVVEVRGARTLVPACSREVEPEMVVLTRSKRVDTSRRMVLDLLGSSVDMSLVDEDVKRWMEQYGADPSRFGPPAQPAKAGDRDRSRAGHHAPTDDATSAHVNQPVKIDNELYIRDYSRCILCYKCVEACGPDAQNTFAIGVAGRGFDARISTEYDIGLPDSACVYCGNCIAVCPTGALMFASEYEMRRDGTWKEDRQTVTRTVCPYCGVGCNLELHVQDNRIVKVASPLDHDVTSGNLCIKGRFGFEFVQKRKETP
jgi:predicted molibdopterin-dependent oxidoreductase YjgC